MFGCGRLGHSWDEHGDCRHCPASIEDLAPDCDDDLAEVAAELALGVLTGRERAQAVMHLDRG